ncbi:hypothetical protein [Marinisporobacter balticus]|uniref:Uncharacterized protein n=1 Tax=Marinisporobacter balticus TaxID=2018667 RepID=A0A4R2L180_9FIRM|nr:hypothetical protein [Marinisporobacter balticus]TCO79342.1 hypothetical protein EV214_10260 [Marinisporobacter balticus]
MQVGVLELSWTITFQIMNTALIIGIIFFVFYLLVKLPKHMKEKEQKIDRIEKTMHEINKKLDNR